MPDPALDISEGGILFVHFSRTLEEGQRVSFVWDGLEADHGRHAAVDVAIVTPGAAHA